MTENQNKTSDFDKPIAKPDQDPASGGVHSTRAKAQRDPNTAGGREGTFSETDAENVDELETEWSPGTNQSE
ncbi:MAG: hypothetical protein ACR2IH_13660 [Pyrinomonadaceae bacterium]